MFYLSTDGYIDQNGGPKDYSFGKQKFKKLLEQISVEPCLAQRDLLDKNLQEYKGDLPQRDDITILGFQLDITL